MNDDELLSYMNRRERQILVHSYLYYELDESIIGDHDFDIWSKQLADLIIERPDIFEKTAYYEDFIGFDGSTGHDLPYTRPEIMSKGMQLLRYARLHR